MLDHRPDIAEGMNALLHRPTRTHGLEKIKVLVRIRPLLEQETGPAAVLLGEGNNVIRVNGKTPNKQLQCSYDAVIGPDVCQDGLSSHVRECTSAVLEGENSTIFAYGQTGSGKTYTMFGAEVEALEAAALGHSRGVIPLAVADLFKGLVSTQCILLSLYLIQIGCPHTRAPPRICRFKYHHWWSTSPSSVFLSSLARSQGCQRRKWRR